MRHEPLVDGAPVSYGLHEVYYDKDGKPFAWTVDSMVGHFETHKDLIKALSMMLKDARKCKCDILDYGMKATGKPPWEARKSKKRRHTREK